MYINNDAEEDNNDNAETSTKKANDEQDKKQKSPILIEVSVEVCEKLV